MAEFERVAEAAQATLAGSSVLNVNSTAAGGDVVLIHDTSKPSASRKSRMRPTISASSSTSSTVGRPSARG
jgi:hypothetical protein